MTTTSATSSTSSSTSGLIQSLGIGSGLDIQSLVTQLVNQDRAAKDAQISRAATDIATQVSSLGTLKGALSTFQSALAPMTSGQVQAMSATSADTTIFTGSATAAAVPGSYTVSVQQLAQPEQLLSTAFAGGAATTFGAGSLQVSVGNTNFGVTVSSATATLADVRDAINGATGNSGVKASLVYGTAGAQLVLTSAQTGAGNAIKVTASGGANYAKLGYTGAGDTHYTEGQKAQDAIVLVSGTEVHSASNTVAAAIDGVTLNLVAAKKDTPITLTIGTNTPQLVSNAQALVTAYNALVGQFNTLGSYDAASKTAGPMFGDWMLNTVQTQVARGMTDSVQGTSGPYATLASVGITTQADGTLVLDQAKLQNALNANPSGVMQLFSGTSGVATRLNSGIEGLLSSTGSIASRDTNLAKSQNKLLDQQTTLNEQMALVQQRYLTQFNALDSLMSQMQSTASYLTTQLNSSLQLANYTSANK